MNKIGLGAIRDVLLDWLAELRWPGTRVEWGPHVTSTSERVNVKLYTEHNVYHITASQTYLGCTVARRAPRAGEEWARGNDLTDGTFSRETWARILGDIVGFELVKLVEMVSPMDRAKSASPTPATVDSPS